MMGRRAKHGRLYQKRGRWYAYLRDIGGGQEAMRPPGEKYATTDRDVATALVSDRVKELEAIRRGIAILGPAGRADTLGTFAAQHLVEKAKAGKVSEGWIAAVEVRLRRAIEFLGAGRPIAGLTVTDMDAYRDWLSALPTNRRGSGTLSGGTVRHHLNDLSNLFKRAQTKGVVPAGYNPVSSMMDRPTAETHEARWLEPHEAALLLEAARLVEPERDRRDAHEGDERTATVCPLHEIVATMLLTGGRTSEVLGLAVDDVNFERKKVTFRPHAWRPLKTRTSHRSVPLWPQLENILRAYLDGADAPTGTLLFPSTHRRVVHREGEHMLTDFRRPLDEAASRAGWEPGEIRSYALRHTYCAARLQTLDRGAPVPTFTVSRELGHAGTAMVQKVYGHLGDVRERSEVVEFRPDVIERIPDAATRKAFTKRLRALRGLSIA